MSESLIPAAEFESATNAVNNILGQPVDRDHGYIAAA